MCTPFFKASNSVSACLKIPRYEYRNYRKSIMSTSDLVLCVTRFSSQRSDS